MRKAFFSCLKNLAVKNKDIHLLTGDLGFKLFDEFRVSCPDRFLDMGVAEANMIGVASGLSLFGKKSYCYSIIPFLVMRAYEQIRIDVAYQKLNVVLVGVGAGFSYGLEGFTHYGLEDLSLMRSMPNMNVVVPADAFEAERIAELSYDFRGPLYIRLGNNNDPLVHASVPKIKIGRGMIIREGRGVVIFAIGSMVHRANEALLFLKKENISATLVNIHTLKPLDKDLIQSLAKSHQLVCTVEEHSIVGGLGSAVAEVLCESSFKGKFMRIGVPEQLSSIVGRAEYLRQAYGLTGPQIAGRIIAEHTK